MTDIVERLRKWAGIVCEDLGDRAYDAGLIWPSQKHADALATTAREAAAEIERLRAENERLRRDLRKYRCNCGLDHDKCGCRRLWANET